LITKTKKNINLKNIKVMAAEGKGKFIGWLGLVATIVVGTYIALEIKDALDLHLFKKAVVTTVTPPTA
jgi:hypothetical protein